MHTHTVFFWLREGLDDQDRQMFFHGIDLLTRERHVRERRVGPPATTHRDVVDSSFSCSIVLRFDSLGDHDAYQVSDEHQVFLDSCLGMIDRVQVYDIAEADL